MLLFCSTFSKMGGISHLSYLCMHIGTVHKLRNTVGRGGGGGGRRKHYARALGKGHRFTTKGVGGRRKHYARALG